MEAFCSQSTQFRNPFKQVIIARCDSTGNGNGARKPDVLAGDTRHKTSHLCFIEVLRMYAHLHLLKLNLWLCGVGLSAVWMGARNPGSGRTSSSLIYVLGTSRLYQSGREYTPSDRKANDEGNHTPSRHSQATEKHVKLSFLAVLHLVRIMTSPDHARV